QGRVGRQAEVDFLADFGCAAPGIRDRLLEYRKVQQRLAAEKRDVRELVRARFLERKLDALARGLFAHELRLPSVLGVDDLVLAVLVAVGARQIALVGDVQHHRGERKRRQRNHFRYRRRWRRDGADRLDARQLGQRRLEVAPIGHLAREVIRRAWVPGEAAQHGIGRRIELENGGARHEVDEGLAGSFEPMVFSRDPGGHLVGSSINQFMYSGTVTSRCARARSLFEVSRASGEFSSATTHTSPTLFRLPERFGLGPSSAGVNKPRSLMPPTNCRSSSVNVAVYSSSDQFTSTIPRSRSSGVSGLPSGPKFPPTASNCCSCFGNTAPPTRAIPACGCTLIASILS